MSAGDWSFLDETGEELHEVYEAVLYSYTELVWDAPRGCWIMHTVNNSGLDEVTTNC